jgi:transketolase
VRDTFGAALITLAREFEDLVVLDGDNATSTQTSRFAEQFPDAFYNMGIAEQNLVSVAAGLALAEYRPIACAFASMLVNRALDQITHSVSYQDLGVVLVGHYAGLSGGREGACHHSISDVAALRAVPNLDLHIPVCDDDVLPVLRAALRTGKPAYVRLSREPSAELPEPDRGSVVDRWRYWGPADPEVLVVACGPVTSNALQALTLVSARAGVFNPLTVAPFPGDDLGAFAINARAVVSVEEHSVVGGLGGAVCEWAGRWRPIPCHRLGIPECFTVSGSHSELLELCRLTPQEIASTIRAIEGNRHDDECR